VLEKVEKVDELVIQVKRVADALEKITGMRLKTPEDNLISWLESGKEKTKIIRRVDKGKDRGIIEMECDNNKWSKIVIEDGEDKMEGVEEVVGTLALSVQFDRVEKK